MRAFILHGWGGDPTEGWLPWLKSELAKQGWAVQVPQMPDTDKPVLEKWLQTLRDLVGKPDENTYFVGHSLGCFTFLKFIEELEPGVRVGGGVMVAGFAGNLKRDIPILQRYYESGLDWDNIKSHGGKYVAIASERDGYVHVQSLHEFGEKLGAKTIVNNDWQHFSGSEGIKELPDVLESLLEISSKK